ncbi:MAG: hypothetical protein IJ015_03090 [Ruminococcus sp.]|nr:hypothetical protein [Ruminococcus sp.]
MKEKLRNAFKETPERFTYAIESALSETKLQKNKQRLTTPLRIVISMVLILAILPSAVFGAVKMYGAIAKRVGNYGVSFDISINEDAPKYVKMNIDVPQGFKEQKNTDRLKYRRKNGEFGFTIFPMRFYDSVDDITLEEDVKEYKEIYIASKPAYELIDTYEHNDGVKRYYVWYEEANVLMLIFCGGTVSSSEFESFVNGITFEEGSKNDHDDFYAPEKEDAGEMVEYGIEKQYKLIDKDTEITFSGFNEAENEGNIPVKATITDIRITDSINGIDNNCIYSMYREDKIADNNGKLLSKQVEVWQNGDGVNSERKLLRCESEKQSLVLIDVKYENTTNKEVKVYLPYRLNTLKKDHTGDFVSSTIIDEYQNIAAGEYCDTEVFYLSSHGESDKDFCIPRLQPNESRTITLGFRCIDAQLSNAYIALNPATDGVISPDYGNGSDTYWIFKVQ